VIAPSVTHNACPSSSVFAPFQLIHKPNVRASTSYIAFNPHQVGTIHTASIQPSGSCSLRSHPLPARPQGPQPSLTQPISSRMLLHMHSRPRARPRGPRQEGRGSWADVPHYPASPPSVPLALSAPLNVQTLPFIPLKHYSFNPSPPHSPPRDRSFSKNGLLPPLHEHLCSVRPLRSGERPGSG
jgi:hypothetical protein